MTCEVCKTTHTIITNTLGGPIELCAQHHRHLNTYWTHYPEAVQRFRMAQTHWGYAQFPLGSTGMEDLKALFEEYSDAEAVCQEILKEWLEDEAQASSG